MKANDKDSGVHLLENKDRITVEELKDLSTEHLLIDVRTPMEFKICKLNGSVNIPMKKLMKGDELDKVDKFNEGKYFDNKNFLNFNIYICFSLLSLPSWKRFPDCS